MAQQNKIRNVRYEEDYGFLKTDSSHRFPKIKYLPVSENSFLSLGGEIRYQAQWFKNEDWGDGPKEEYLAFYTRFMFHGDMHINRFRAFAQLNSTFAVGRPDPNRPIDENRLGVHQLFFEYKLWENPSKYLTARVGRQEMSYGSERLITVREGPNNRLSFDAAKLFYKSTRYGIDAFYARPVQILQGVFDDEISGIKALWAMYGVWNMNQNSKMDHYYIGFEDELASFNGFSPEQEVRHSIGSRWSGVWRKLSFDLEALYQFGSFGEQRISAYTASANLFYSLDQFNSKPGFGLKTEVISGDKVRSDDILNSFNPMFPRGAYFGLAAIIGPVNLIDVHPSFQVSLADELVFSMDYDLFWRFSTQDGIYGPNVRILYLAESEERKIGNQMGVNLEYSPNDHLSIVPEFTWFQADEYLKEVGAGKDVLFAALTVQYRY
ncbi:alginate export family protein [Algoriphagus sp. A40]|uniref:alginate export family protein n=1 Tax=Algoriphagus sp. A40 TaxID=1945863 RepID=UPI00143B9640|nr:alginate export family protein [Algoriphagus sp. A40]